MQPSAQTIRQNILTLLDDLPPDSLLTVETFIRFVRHQQQQQTTSAPALPEDEPPWQYPTVPVPADSLDNLIGIMPQVEGDALADTEALYDEG